MKSSAVKVFVLFSVIVAVLYFGALALESLQIKMPSFDAGAAVSNFTMPNVFAEASATPDATECHARGGYCWAACLKVGFAVSSDQLECPDEKYCCLPQ